MAAGGGSGVFGSAKGLFYLTLQRFHTIFNILLFAITALRLYLVDGGVTCWTT
jgi:hypothetical protein